MTALVAAALVSLCVTDASLAGYRSVCGRSAFVDRSALDRRAVRLGAEAGVVTVGALGAWFAALLLVTGDGEALDDLTRAGTAMLAVYAGFALVTTVALAAWYLAPLRWGTLAMVTVLGPLTLVRPLVIVAGGAWAVASTGGSRGSVVASVAFVLVAVWFETALLDRWGSRTAASFRPSAGQHLRAGNRMPR